MELERAVDTYLRHVALERGLSDHTVAAYRRDLEVYTAWLRARDVVDAEAVTAELVAAFGAERASADPPPAASSPPSPAVTGRTSSGRSWRASAPT